jgi:prepilin-type N-terminal cleavage/methylation domain-containing protein
MKKAFTLIELIVAVALLAIIFLFAGVIFKVSINSYRTAVANAEIMQKLRAITDQLNADFKGIRTDAPLLIWFHEDNTPTDPNRYDQIMLFADGDFQSTQLYGGPPGFEAPDPAGYKLVIGDAARIFYGQAQSRDSRDGGMKYHPENLLEKDRLLAKRQHILTADPCLADWPPANMSDFNDIATAGADKKNERYEHDSNSLAKWKTVQGIDYGNKIIPACFYFRPYIDMSEPNTFHKLMCEGVGSFAIQWAYWDSVDGRFYWFPSSDPDGDGSDADSHFSLICPVCNKLFGVYFNIPSPTAITDWYAVGALEYRSFVYFPPDFYPKAIKFTFTLYDSKAVFKEGRIFTHIVYIGN